MERMRAVDLSTKYHNTENAFLRISYLNRSTTQYLPRASRIVGLIEQYNYINIEPWHLRGAKKILSKVWDHLVQSVVLIRT